MKALFIILSALIGTFSFGFAETTIDRVEYFIGDDPGHGQATALAVDPGLSAADLNIEVPSDAFPEGEGGTVTARALDSDGDWSKPITFRVRPQSIDEGGLVVTGIEYTVPGEPDAPVVEVPVTIPEGETYVDVDLDLSATELSPGESATGWIRSVNENGVPYSFPVTFHARRPVERILDTKIGDWVYVILDNEGIVASGFAEEIDDGLLGGFDLDGLDPDVSYMLHVIPREQARNIPIATLGATVSLGRDFDVWRHAHFSDEERDDDSVSGPGADPDESETTNFERFVAGVGPDEPFAGLQADFFMIPDGDESVPSLTLDRSRLARSALFSVEASTDLSNWEVIPVEKEAFEVSDEMDELLFVPEVAGEAAEGKQFFRVQIEPGEAYE